MIREDAKGSRLLYGPVKMRKLGMVVQPGDVEKVGTYDLGRRYRILKEGSFPPFKESVATYLCARTPGGKLIWGDRVDDPAT